MECPLRNYLVFFVVVISELIFFGNRISGRYGKGGIPLACVTGLIARSIPVCFWCISNKGNDQ